MASRSALLVVDAISDFRFEDGNELYPSAHRAARNIATLKKNLLSDDAILLYINDNDEGRIATVAQLFESAAATKKGSSILKILRPERDLVILKPQRSGFFETDLEKRLREKDVERVVIAGWTTDICVLFTAHDAFMRKFKVAVPADCTAAVKPTHHSDALRFLRRVAEANVSPAVS